jgi:uncharacterized protein
VAATSIAIISDTHLPKGARTLPPACVDRLRAADLIIHAGDWSAWPVVELVSGYGELAAVHGNVEEEAVAERLPDRLELTVAGVRLGVVHNGGPAQGRLARMHRRWPEVDAVIFGHSHMPLHERDPDSGFQIFNPGSPTDKRRQPHFTMGWAEVADGAATFEIVRLGP